MHYYIDDSDKLYFYMVNGIQDFDMNNYATKYNIAEVFNKKAKNCVPVIIKLTETGAIYEGKKILVKGRSMGLVVTASFSYPEFLEVIDPKFFGINHSAASMVFNIYKAGNDFVITSLQKITQKLAVKNEDLADYLSLAIKIATNESCKNSKISYEYLANKLSGEKLAIFKQNYDKAIKDGEKLNISNLKKTALFSAMIKSGINET